MKKTFAIVSMVLLFILSSCSQDPDGIQESSTKNGGMPEMQYPVKEGNTECSLPTRSLPEGVYQIVLKESGKAMEFRKFEKK